LRQKSALFAKRYKVRGVDSREMIWLPWKASHQAIAAFILGDALSAKKQVQFAWVIAKPDLNRSVRVRYASAYN